MALGDRVERHADDEPTRIHRIQIRLRMAEDDRRTGGHADRHLDAFRRDGGEAELAALEPLARRRFLQLMAGRR